MFLQWGLENTRKKKSEGRLLDNRFQVSFFFPLDFDCKAVICFRPRMNRNPVAD